MDETQLVLRNVFSNPVTLLWVAVVLGILFVGLLFFDYLFRRNRVHHSRRLRPPPESLGKKLLKPFRLVREAAKLLLETAHRRARRRARSERLAEQMRRYRR